MVVVEVTGGESGGNAIENEQRATAAAATMARLNALSAAVQRAKTVSVPNANETGQQVRGYGMTCTE